MTKVIIFQIILMRLHRSLSDLTWVSESVSNALIREKFFVRALTFVFYKRFKKPKAQPSQDNQSTVMAPLGFELFF